jgi:selenocysteine lyase/cysteine desulfurase
VDVDGYTPSELGNKLHTDYKIHTTAIEYSNVLGVRITPHVYIVKDDLDRLIDALHRLADA